MIVKMYNSNLELISIDSIITNTKTKELIVETIEEKRTPCETRGTLAHFKKYRWKELNKRTINGAQAKRLGRPGNASYLKKQTELRISKEEFYKFCEDNWTIIKSLYDNKKTPSIDRIDSNGHYELSNMRIIDLKENVSRRLLK